MWVRIVLAALTAAGISLGAVVDIERNSMLLSCLQNTGLGGTVVTPLDSSYEMNRAAYNQRLSYKPAAIAYPKTPEDVQQYVKCAAESSTAVTARSGGHSYAAYSVGGQDGALIVDLQNMKSLTVDRLGAAKVQTGNRLGDVAQKIWDNGQRALPHGTCPYVGIGGHTAFGGYGPFSRIGGLLHDRVIEAQVVLANGTLTVASAASNPDLFWALRGAGASYGIVTQWTFATLAAPPTVVVYSVDYSSGLDGSKIASLLDAWQRLAISAPKEMAMLGAIGPNRKGKLNLRFTGNYYGHETDFNSLTSNWSSLLSPGKVNVKVNNWYDALIATDGPLSTTGPAPRDTFFAKSLFTKTAVVSDRWSAFVKYLESSWLSGHTNWFVGIDLYGGMIRNMAADATSFAHRNALFSFQFYASSNTSLPPYPSSGIQFVNDMLKALEPYPKAAYVNYVDPTLTDPQWKSQYYGPHYPRLSSIKRAVDPKNVFRFPQSIGFS